MTHELPFTGRQSDLQELGKAWRRVLLGHSSLFVLRGDSGLGKTRLLREFYDKLRHNSSGAPYWPEFHSSDPRDWALVPDVAHLSSSHTDLPYLWLAVRCRERDPNEAPLSFDVAFDAVRRQLQAHVGPILGRQRRSTANDEIAGALFSLVLSFAWPGIGPSMEIFRAVLELAEKGITTKELASAVRHRISERSSESEKPDRDFVDAAVNAFKAIAAVGRPEKGQQSLPIALVVDDAHWADPLTLTVLDRLLRESRTRGWRLLVIVATWSDPLEYPDVGPYCRDLAAFLDGVQRQRDPMIPVVSHELPVLDAGELAALVRSAVPNLEPLAAGHLSERSAGDIRLLVDLANELIEGPGWLDRDGKLAVAPDTLDRLPSRPAEIARLRLARLGGAIRAAVMWAGAQGVVFDEAVAVALEGRLGSHAESTVHDSLSDASAKFGVITLSDERILGRCGEFRRRPYFDASRELIRSHPNPSAILEALAWILRGIREGTQWPKLDSAVMLRLARRVIELIDQLGLSRAGDWAEKRLGFLLDIALVSFQSGDHLSTQLAARELQRTAPPGSTSEREAFELLVRSSYVSGQVESEGQILNEWATSRASGDALYWAYRSRYEIRQSQPARAISSALRAVDMTTSAREKAVAEIDVATALWAAGQADSAHRRLVDVEEQSRDLIHDDAPLRLALCHTACLVLHDLERNATLASYARECVAAYESSNEKHQSLISQVNLADALWAVGRSDEAVRILRDVCDVADAASFPHVSDIAAICLANVLAATGKLADAIAEYEKGIKLAEEIGHDWDSLYGRIYHELARQEAASHFNALAFAPLVEEANRREYWYLANLGVAASLVACAEGRQWQQLPEIRSLVSPPIARFPLVRVMDTAADVLQAEGKDLPSALRFLDALGECEGIHLRPRFVADVLTRLDADLQLGREIGDFVTRWQGRFKEHQKRVPGPCLTRCDYVACEARCCYDGVYLNDDEVGPIRTLVAEHPEFFAHVPEEFLVESAWEHLAGLKTAVRPHEYSAPDFPEHFPKTRCVFALADGACSLQAFGERLDPPAPWKYKPMACWLHPLRVRDGVALAPVDLTERDTDATGLAYPGFGNFTPCGQARSDGSPWDIVLADELRRWQSRVSGEQRNLRK